MLDTEKARQLSNRILRVAAAGLVQIRAGAESEGVFRDSEGPASDEQAKTVFNSFRRSGRVSRIPEGNRRQGQEAL